MTWVMMAAALKMNVQENSVHIKKMFTNGSKIYQYFGILGLTTGSLLIISYRAPLIMLLFVLAYEIKSSFELSFFCSLLH